VSVAFSFAAGNNLLLLSAARHRFFPFGGCLFASKDQGNSWITVYENNTILQTVGNIAFGNGIFVFDQNPTQFSTSSDGFSKKTLFVLTINSLESLRCTIQADVWTS
jgi:hypothetical protein